SNPLHISANIILANKGVGVAAKIVSSESSTGRILADDEIAPGCINRKAARDIVFGATTLSHPQGIAVAVQLRHKNIGPASRSVIGYSKIDRVAKVSAQIDLIVPAGDV